MDDKTEEEYMATHINERDALQMTLQSLLELRVSLRRDYVDQDKELGQEIKQVLHRIRELDEHYGAPTCTDYREEKKTGRPADPKEILATRKGTPRKPNQHYDYPGIAREVETILEEAAEPLTLTELYREIQKRQRVEWPYPYIIIQKALKHSERVKIEKEGRKLVFSIL
jgi:hypothetical protein